MSTDPSFKCSQCKKDKLSSEYGTRQKRDQLGQKGDRLSLCLSCSAANSARRKRKRTENNHDHPAKRLATQHPISPSQFVAALATYASASEINDSWRVSVDEMTQADKDIAKHLASLAWKATGYRFSLYRSHTTADRSSTRFSYQCCQARGTMNDLPKQSAVTEEKQRIAHRMERFDCHGRLHVALRNGIAVVEVTHSQSHKSYMDISLPEKWRTFIENNHKKGPVQLWQDILSQSKGDDIAFTQKTVRYAWSRVASEQWHDNDNPIVDDLLHESEPDQFTEQLSLDGQRKDVENCLLMAIDLLRSQPSDINPDWFAKFCEGANHLIKFVKHNIRDDSSHAPEEPMSAISATNRSLPTSSAAI